MATPAEVRTQLLQLWAIQSNLLMTYRSLFLTGLSILFAPGLVLVAQEPRNWRIHVVLIALAVCGISVSVVWKILQKDRALDINYLRARLAWAEIASNLPTVKAHKPIVGLQEWREAKFNESRRITIKCELTRSGRDILVVRLLQPDRAQQYMGRGPCVSISLWFLLLIFDSYHWLLSQVFMLTAK